MQSCCPSSSFCSADATGTQRASCSIMLVGNPNCGKTTLFNALTGTHQRVGNWPGVTVERKSGYFSYSGTLVEVTDLPGIYSLALVSDTVAVDEQIAVECITNKKTDLILNIVDASNLERHLYLTTQLIEMGIPIILALNMMDVAHSRQIHIDIKKLAEELGCPVVALSANKGSGITELKRVMVSEDHFQKLLMVPYPPVVQEAIHHINNVMISDKTFVVYDVRHPGDHRGIAARLLEEDVNARRLVSDETIKQVQKQQDHIHQTMNEEADILIADARYRYIQQLIQQCVSHSTMLKTTWSTRIDNLVLNRLLGIPIFLGIMYLLFVFSINVGGAFQDFFDISSQTIFVDGLAAGLEKIGAPTWLTALLASGIGKGINTTVTFIPVIGSMFLFLALLEDSGYMARAAFVIDRCMRLLGLPGKAFVPMIVGFGCNVPAIMGARTLENKCDRILTIMMTPFMSCGARLAIFAVFTTAFFPHGGQNIVFILYVIGILMAVLTGFLLRQTVLKGEPSPLIMELPPYHIPHMRTLLLHAWQRLKSFVYRAGRLIVPICVLIGALNALNVDGTINTGDGDAHSLLSLVGQWATPLFAPMGIKPDNWPATVGLATGVLAKEVVVGTLNTLYSQVGHFADAASQVGEFQLWTGLSQALQSIPQNLSQISSVFSNPVLAQAPISAVNQSVYGLMYQKFDGQIGAFAYLLFVLLYFPCISTMAVMMRELHRGWSVFSGIWMTGVAYGTAVTFYQAATWSRHPLSSSIWILVILGLFCSVVMWARWYVRRNEYTVVPRMSEARPGEAV
ncbi:MAG: Fe(2+) transporter permease subunit FeoB [Gammaproteobacteria bacterium]|nr:Fe(2+) transporter permease subunit FeoB [Gammaproteobacteria bacterium]MCW5583149.1 Fe(2+) transporter permease subunit FeoB [Gammaproteobacteria bacterium]